MKKCILYKQEDGILAIVLPSNEALNLYGIDAIAQKDVPEGKPYKIVEINNKNFPLDGTFNEYGVPNMDRTFREAWTIDELELSDGVGSNMTTF